MEAFVVAVIFIVVMGVAYYLATRPTADVSNGNIGSIREFESTKDEKQK